MADNAKLPDAAGPRPLGRIVEDLARRKREAQRAREQEVPVLTEVVDPAGVLHARAELDSATLETLAVALEQSVLEHLQPALAQMIDERIAHTLAETVVQASEALRAELAATVRQMLRDSIASSFAAALGSPPRAPAPPAAEAARDGSAKPADL